MKEEKPVKRKIDKPKKSKWHLRIIILLWIIALSPFIGLYVMLNIADNDLPSFEELENPRSNLATEVVSCDGKILGRYFKENRTNAQFEELPPCLLDLLVATEDERFYKHSGVDGEALMRVIKGVLTGSTSSGGGSTLTQQLAKLLFPRPPMNTWELVQRKFKEWIVAARLEKSYTKTEILTMYLNQFDFIHNAVGINSGSRVYFNCKPLDLRIEQAAMLVGMAKNPSLYNPLRDSVKAITRRNVVLHQLLKNNENSTISTHITQAEYDSLKLLPLGIDYQRVDHQEGPAPYFREILRLKLRKLFEEKNEDGTYVYAKDSANSIPYDIYSDGLKIYTTIDSRLQKYAEWAVEKHLGGELQWDFDNNNKKWKNPPFSNDLKKVKIDSMVYKALLRSDRGKILTGKLCGECNRPAVYISKIKISGKYYWHCSHCGNDRTVPTTKEMDEDFNTPVHMKVFAWKKKDDQKDDQPRWYEIDTVMSPRDSVFYYKSFLQTGLISIDPHTGYIKAWVGGPNFKHFKFDHVYQSKRQVGSTFKPFVYGTAISDGVSPCEEISNIQWCFDIPNGNRTKQWCPKNSDGKYDALPTSLRYGLANSMNSITAGLLKNYSSPQAVINFARKMGITSNLEPVPAICLGVFDLSVYEMVSSLATYANKGVHIDPLMITRIEDKNGNVIVDFNPKTVEAVDERTAYIMLEMMEGVTDGAADRNHKPMGTGVRLKWGNRPYGKVKYPVAGKTGTTQNNSDGWFMGLTPDLVTGVWTGAEDRSVRFRSTYFGQGANMALPIWGWYMNKVWADKSIKISKGDFEAPVGMKPLKDECKDYYSGPTIAPEETNMWGNEGASEGGN